MPRPSAASRFGRVQPALRPVRLFALIGLTNMTMIISAFLLGRELGQLTTQPFFLAMSMRRTGCSAYVKTKTRCGIERMQKPIMSQFEITRQQPSHGLREKRRGPLRVRLARLAVWVAELHPYTWNLAWILVRRFSFLLPHDKSYYALRHFVALKPNGLFLDVGANDGISALSFRQFDKTYKILSLEPNRLLEPSLKKIKARDPHFDYIMAGAGTQPSKVRFHVPVYKGIVLHTSTSSSLEHTRSALAASFGKSIAAAARINPIEGRIIRVDDLKVAPTIIKIDAEGFNYEVLLGAAETIGRLRPFLIIEIESEEAEKISGYFEGLRYQLVGYDVMLDRFCAGAGTPYSDLYRNFFAVPDEMMPSLPWTGPTRMGS
jgi:FkbM family methyltransferase